MERRSLAELWPPDTLLVLPDESHVEPEVTRTWEEAAHHVDLARRRGEDAPARELLFDPPAALLAALRRFARVCVADPQAERDVLVFPIREPESIGRDVKLLRRVVREGTPTIILCDNTGQAERLEELLNEGEWSPSPAGNNDRRPEWRLHSPAGTQAQCGAWGTSHESRRFRRVTSHESRVTWSPGPHRPRDLPPRPATPPHTSVRHPASRSRRSPRSSPATTSCISSTASGSTAASRRSSCARARSRSR